MEVSAAISTPSNKGAEYGFGYLARAEPVAVAKHVPMIVVLAIEEYERLKALDEPAGTFAGKRTAST